MRGLLRGRVARGFETLAARLPPPREGTDPHLSAVRGRSHFAAKRPSVSLRHWPKLTLVDQIGHSRRAVAAKSSMTCSTIASVTAAGEIRASSARPRCGPASIPSRTMRSFRCRCQRAPELILRARQERIQRLSAVEPLLGPGINWASDCRLTGCSSIWAQPESQLSSGRASIMDRF